MLTLTLNAVVVCPHEVGIVTNSARQNFVTIEGVPVLVATDPEQRSIVGCPNTIPAAGIKPCLVTLRVADGYSSFVRIAGAAMCMDTVSGFTDGTPPGTHRYRVRSAGQSFVSTR